jgi:Ca2+-binding RTX toxin-like protein
MPYREGALSATEVHTSSGRDFEDRGRSRMRWLMAAVTALAAAVLAPSAFAATASVTGGIVDYQAAPGEANDVEGILTPDIVTIVDPGAVIVAGDGCSSVSEHEVTCTTAAPSFIGVRLVLGDGDDTAELTSSVLFENAMDGGEGDDHLINCLPCETHFTDFVGGPGDDTLEAGEPGGRLEGDDGTDTLIGSLTEGDFLIGGEGSDTLRGRGGDDLIWGGVGVEPEAAGDDTITAGKGADEIMPAAGDDHVDGGPGRDELVLRHAPGPVTVRLRPQTIVGPEAKTIAGIEDVFGTGFADRIYGDEGPNRVTSNGLVVGRGGADVVQGDGRFWGGRGNDLLMGGFARDVLVGGPGRDILHGSRGRDRMYGGEGNDKLSARDRYRDIVSGGSGFDWAKINRPHYVNDVVRSIERVVADLFP